MIPDSLNEKDFWKDKNNYNFLICNLDTIQFDSFLIENRIRVEEFNTIINLLIYTDIEMIVIKKDHVVFFLKSNRSLIFNKNNNSISEGYTMIENNWFYYSEFSESKF